MPKGYPGRIISKAESCRRYYIKRKAMMLRYFSESPYNRRSIYQKVRLKVVIALGGKCLQCGFCDERALQVDHVNGGGSRKTKSGIHYLNHVLKNIASGDYQLLCANCNWIKRYENSEVVRKY